MRAAVLVPPKHRKAVAHRQDVHLHHFLIGLRCEFAAQVVAAGIDLRFLPEITENLVLVSVTGVGIGTDRSFPRRDARRDGSVPVRLQPAHLLPHDTASLAG